MTALSYEIDINAPVEKVFTYYTDPNNIKESWPSDIVKESSIVSGTRGEKGSVFKVKGQYLGKQEEMRVQVIEKWPNKKFITKQVEGPFKKWESIQEFQDANNATHIKHSVEYELPMTGRIVNLVSGKEAENKIRSGLEQAVQTVKHKMESS
jgi:ligand-binding SRPBCC domain-containing protein